MRVGIDISAIPYNRGVSRYTSNLVLALAKEKNLDLNLYGSSLRQKDALEQFAKTVCKSKDAKSCVSKFQNYPQSILNKLWQLGLNPISKQLPNLDLFHSWDWLQPPDKNLPLVSTIHDLAILKFPETAHPQILKMHQRAWKILRQREAEIIAVSQATKQDLIELLDWDSKKISIIYEALPQETVNISKNLSEEQSELIKNKLNLNKPYLFFVGTREPRKNLVRLIKAWQPLAKDYQLIIAGESGWDETSKKPSPFSGEGLESKSRQRADTRGEARPRFLGRVSDEELAVLYMEAEVFCYPSLYEGFGLPILEAFHYGTPVLTSDVSSMPEVAGNAAQLVNPNSITDIRQGIEKILNEDQAMQQKRLQKMIIRLHQFSWEKAARETVEVYKKAINK